MTTTLTIVIPAFNEERRLPRLLDRLTNDVDRAAAAADLSVHEVIVVDDGSSDGTAEILRSFTALGSRLQVRRFDRNRGKGAAVREGMLVARGEVALMTDVDLSTPLEELGLLAEALSRGADIAIGSRGLANSHVLVHQPIYRELMGKTFNLMLRGLTGIPWRDTQCGFKLFRLETARILFELQRVERFAFDAELLVNARRLGLVTEEIPVRWIDDPDTHVRLVTGSLQMAVDALRIAYRARRPFPK
jgi:glycosyltransferase involved in cell wall biosynthesis